MTNKRQTATNLRVFFDPFIRLTFPTLTFQRLVLQPAGLCDADRVLDLGCGTGSLAIFIKRLHPKTEVFGLDVDTDILEIAKAKALRKGVSINFKQAPASDLPFPDASINHIFSTLMFHELDPKQKRQTLNESLRVLCPDGTLHIADFGKPANWLMRLALGVIRLSHRPDTLADNLKGTFPHFIREAGFEEVEERSHVSSLFGTISIWRAKKSAMPDAIPDPIFVTQTAKPELKEREHHYEKN